MPQATKQAVAQPDATMTDSQINRLKKAMKDIARRKRRGYYSGPVPGQMPGEMKGTHGEIIRSPQP